MADNLFTRALKDAERGGVTINKCTIVHREDGYTFGVDVLTIFHAAEQAGLSDLCRPLAGERCKFNFPPAGFPMGSSRWQQWFTTSLDSCDAILVALTAGSLGDKWLKCDSS